MRPIFPRQQHEPTPYVQQESSNCSSSVPHFTAAEVRVYFFDGHATEELAPVIVAFVPGCLEARISPD